MVQRTKESPRRKTDAQCTVRSLSTKTFDGEKAWKKVPERTTGITGDGGADKRRATATAVTTETVTKTVIIETVTKTVIIETVTKTVTTETAIETTIETATAETAQKLSRSKPVSKKRVLTPRVCQTKRPKLRSALDQNHTLDHTRNPVKSIAKSLARN